MNMLGHDLTELERVQRQLEAARIELQEFVYTVSHDLRAPLRHITSFAQIIAEDMPDMPADIAAHLATIRQSAQLLTQQLEGLAMLSRLGEQALTPGAVDTAALVRDVVDDLARQHPQRQVHWRVAPDLPVVQSDAAMVRQVLLIVLDNALKFTRCRELADISVSWQLLDAGQCCVSVQDNGVGFAPQQADKLFKVFGKLHLPRKFEGLGLGLVQARTLMERMGGHISVTGEVQNGCCVNLLLNK